VPNSPEHDLKILHRDDSIVIQIQQVSLLTYRQWMQWHELLIAGPATNCSGRRGNSFPGMYYYHPAHRTQWVVMVEGPVDWRECRLDVLPRGGPLELGLFSTGTIDPEVRLRVWHSKIDDVPNQWEALETLVARSFLLTPLPERPDSTPDWAELASRCFAGLSKEDVQHPLAKQLGGIAYHSMWDEYTAMYARPKPYIELICQASIARALHLAAQHIAIKDGASISHRLVEHVIPQFFNSNLGIFENAYPIAESQGRKKLVLDTWYALSNLSDILYLCGAFPTDDLRELAAQAVSTWMAIGKEIGHIFPLFLDAVSRESQGGKLNVAAGGLYANVMLSAVELKAEAAQALTVMRRFPVQQMFHQPEQLARAAESAFLLGVEDSAYEKIGEDFIHALLLMLYRDSINAGLFEGCAGMMYPTFRESVASLVTLASLGGRFPNLPIKNICELGISRCFRFLKHYGAEAVLPVEGLATKEVPTGANIGTAIYAAGGVFDLAYLQTALN
jgi:hypothetical protein